MSGKVAQMTNLRFLPEQFGPDAIKFTTHVGVKVPQASCWSIREQ